MELIHLRQNSFDYPNYKENNLKNQCYLNEILDIQAVSFCKQNYTLINEGLLYIGNSVQTDPI